MEDKQEIRPLNEVMNSLYKKCSAYGSKFKGFPVLEDGSVYIPVLMSEAEYNGLKKSLDMLRELGGCYHRDIKPSNILVKDKKGPILDLQNLERC